MQKRFWVNAMTGRDQLRQRVAFALGEGSQMLQPLAIVVVGGLLSSMILSLIITPAVHFYLQSPRSGTPS